MDSELKFVAKIKYMEEKVKKIYYLLMRVGMTNFKSLLSHYCVRTISVVEDF